MNKAESYRMQIKWNTKTAEWFQRASEYTGFHTNLADIMCESIGADQTVCDLGCGAGLIGFELCKRVKSVTCVDKEATIIHMLNKEIYKRQIPNIQAVCEDISTLQGKWDVISAVFVGNVTNHIEKYLHLCEDKLILIVRGGCINNTVVGDKVKERHSLIPLYSQLYEAGVNYWVSDHTLEYGQPFVDMREAYEYAELYHKNPYYMSIDEYLKKNLVHTKEAPYPYYLPYRKRFAVFEIRKIENLHLL